MSSWKKDLLHNAQRVHGRQYALTRFRGAFYLHPAGSDDKGQPKSTKDLKAHLAELISKSNYPGPNTRTYYPGGMGFSRASR